MKTIYIARHSHTEEHSMFGKDISRKLTPQGLTDASIMAARIKAHSLVVDVVITSNATRAIQTAEIYAKELNCKLIQEASLYNAAYTTIQKVLEQTDDDINTILLVAHNPGVTNYINALQIVALDNMPTAGVFGFESDANAWTDVHNAEKHYSYFNYPSLH